MGVICCDGSTSWPAVASLCVCCVRVCASVRVCVCARQHLSTDLAGCTGRLKREAKRGGPKKSIAKSGGGGQSRERKTLGTAMAAGAPLVEGQQWLGGKVGGSLL